jgi:hypothetical protein
MNGKPNICILSERLLKSLDGTDLWTVATVLSSIRSYMPDVFCGDNEQALGHLLKDMCAAQSFDQVYSYKEGLSKALGRLT